MCNELVILTKQYHSRELYDILEGFEFIYYEFYRVNRVQKIGLGGYLHEYGSSIVHLIYTNNTCENIRLYCQTSFMFLCQFHNEKTPSMGATLHNNFVHCFGCGYRSNPISYIMSYENLTYQEAVSLLARIYLIDLDYNTISEDDELVLKYRQTLLSDEFKNIILLSYKRRQDKELYDCYEKTLNLIDRVRNDEHIKFPIDKPMVLKYNAPFDMKKK